MALPGIDPRAKLNSDAIDERAKTYCKPAINPSYGTVNRSSQAPRMKAIQQKCAGQSGVTAQKVVSRAKPLQHLSKTFEHQAETSKLH